MTTLAIERSVEITWLMQNLTPGSVLDIGSAESKYIDFLLDTGRRVTLIDPRQQLFARATTITSDARNISPAQLGTFNNVVLISTLEHIGLGAYGLPAAHGDPFEEQLKMLKHCMGFNSTQGQLLLSIPCGKYEHGGWYLVYDRDMLATIKQCGRLVSEQYWTLDHGQDCYIQINEPQIPAVGIDWVDTGCRASTVALYVMRYDEEN